MTDSSIPANWKSEHLFVLVGGNPLPNYVASRLLLRDGGMLHLVHTPETAEVAGRISKNLAADSSNKRHQVQDASDGREIVSVLRGAIDDLGSDESIGLNYTGGTKAMAVHAHGVFRDPPSIPQKNPPLTYLDARTLTMRRDQNGEPLKIQFDVLPTIKTLLDLHGIELKGGKPKRAEALDIDLNQTLALAHQSAEGQNAYETWCQRNLRCLKKTQERECHETLNEVLENNPSLLSDIDRREELFNQVLTALRGTSCNRGNLVKKESHFPIRPIPYPTDPALRDVADEMRRMFGQQGDTFDPGEVVALKTLEFSKIGEFVKYLDGDWVEHLTLSAFDKNRQSRRIHDVALSLHTTNPPYEFEFDVAAMQGYQLYAVSCTRSNDRGLCKSKLFEAYVRAAQLGGDEAKVGLVCCDKDPRALEDQVTELWQTQRGRIRVFGPNDLPNLAERFGEWLTV